MEKRSRGAGGGKRGFGEEGKRRKWERGGAGSSSDTQIEDGDRNLSGTPATRSPSAQFDPVISFAPKELRSPSQTGRVKRRRGAGGHARVSWGWKRYCCCATCRLVRSLDIYWLLVQLARGGGVRSSRRRAARRASTRAAPLTNTQPSLTSLPRPLTEPPYSVRPSVRAQIGQRNLCPSRTGRAHANNN